MTNDSGIRIKCVAYDACGNEYELCDDLEVLKVLTKSNHRSWAFVRTESGECMQAYLELDEAKLYDDEPEVSFSILRYDD